MDHAKTGGLGSSNLRPISFLHFNNNNNLFPSVHVVVGLFRTNLFLCYSECGACFCTKGGYGLEHHVHPANR